MICDLLIREKDKSPIYLYYWNTKGLVVGVNSSPLGLVVGVGPLGLVVEVGAP